jgi:MoxR-like ATPase
MPWTVRRRSRLARRRPRVGETTLRTLARVLGLKYSRIQFTPGLMPADIVGSMIIDTEGGAGLLRG